MKNAVSRTVAVAYLMTSIGICMLYTAPASAQEPAATEAQKTISSQAGVPRLLRFAGTAKDVNGNSLTGVIGVTFAIYTEQSGGTPLWLETQNVQADGNGRYSVLLGSTKRDGVPADLFISEQARWVGMRVAGQAEQPRVLLVSAPYALKAGDAETIGGLPPSAFVLAAPPVSSPAAATSSVTGSVPPPATGVTTTGGAANFLPVFNGTSTIIDSVVFQAGTGTTAKVGIGTTIPGATLDVKGGANVEGLLKLPATGVATAGGGKNSQAQELVASSFNSGTSAAVNQTFQWKAEATGNNTTTPSGTLNLLFGSGAAAPTETGLKLNNKGVFTFAPGQTFPGSGAITKITAGTDLTGGGTGGNVTLNLDTTKVPQLNTNNNFTGNQTLLGGYINVLTTSGSGSAFAVQAVNENTTGQTFGVFALNNSPAGAGVVGYSVGLSNTGSGDNNSNFSSGIWADSSNATTSSRQALLATADDASSILAVNNSPSGYPTIFAVQNGSSSSAILAFSGTGTAITAASASGTPLVWTNGSSLTNDQNGSIELGGNNTGANISGKTPYIDFHYGTGAAQDYNARLINDADGQLSVNFKPSQGSGSLNVNGLVKASVGFAGQCLQSGSFSSSGTNSCNMDLAEAYSSAEATEAGDLVSLVPGAEATVRKSGRRYEALLLGVVSSNPGLVFDNGQTHLAGNNSQLIAKDKTIIALAGRVPVKVSMENGPIRVGDPLTSSSKSGVAMKAKSAGKIIGYALEPANQAGKVLSFIQPGYYAAPEVERLRRENLTLRTQLKDLVSQVQTIRTELDRTPLKADFHAPVASAKR